MGSCLSTDGGGSSYGCCNGSCAPSSAKRDKRNKTSLQAAAAEAQTDAHLARIPGRMWMNGASNIACMFTQQGRKGTNQDAMLVWEEFGSNMDTVFCGVFDGHGPYGHLVAKRVRDSLPSKLCSHWEAMTRGDEGNNNIREAGNAVGSINSDETASITMDEEWKEAEGEDTEDLAVKAPDMLTAWKESFLKAFKVMDKELRFHPTIDCFCSGTTAVTLLKQGEDLVMGNVGDSRAVLGTRDDDNSLIAVQLTVDLKPNLPKEAERIKQFKGRVFALQDEPDVARVWLPHDDSPGLAMARAFGDFCLKDFGLIAVPDISYRRLTERDEFIVLATDGIYATVKSGSIAIAASTLDSLLDLMAGGILWFTHLSMKNINIYKYPIGKLRVQPVGIIVFAAIMATLGFQVLIEAVRQLIEDKGSTKMSYSQLEWLYIIMLSATGVKLALWLYCRTSRSEIVRAYAKDHYFDVVTNVVGLAAAVLGDKFFWWIDPAGAIALALYTIINWSTTVLENAASLVGQTAPPEMLQKLTYLVIKHDPLIQRVDTVRAYTFGVLYFVEVDIELPEDLPLKVAHTIGESLQIKIENLPEVERAFVHLDFECDHKPEHSVLTKLPPSDP